MLEYFITKECLSLYWDTRGFVYGILARCKNTDSKIDILSVSESNSEATLELNLKKVIETLNPDNKFYTIAGGAMANEIFFELKMPILNKENLKKALEFELPRQLPCSLDDMVWSYRPYKADPQTNTITVRIWAILKKTWAQKQNEILEHDIKIDSFLMPFMCEFETNGEILDDVFLRSIDEDYSLNKSPDGLMEMIPSLNQQEAKENLNEWLKKRINVSEDVKAEHPKIATDENWYPVFVMAIDSLSKNFKENKKYLPSLPPEMIPQRFREWKFACLVLASIGCMLLMALAGRSWYDAHSRLAAIRAEKTQIFQQLSKIKKENSSSKEIDATIKKIFEASTGNAEILKCIHFMTETIPDNMWLIELNSNNDKMDLAVKTSGEGEVDSINWAKSNNMLSLENIRKRRNNDGSTDVFLQLIYHRDRIIDKPKTNDRNKVVVQ
jgi:hypothetical protein